MEREIQIITSRTLRPQDLLEAYAQELELTLTEINDKHHRLITEAYDTASTIEQLEGDEHEDDVTELYEQAHYILEDLEEALNTHAPEGYYFGTNPHTPDEKGWFPIGWWEEY